MYGNKLSKPSKFFNTPKVFTQDSLFFLRKNIVNQRLLYVYIS